MLEPTFTAIARSTLARACLGAVIAKGRSIIWPLVTELTPMSQTGLFAASVWGEVIWAYSGTKSPGAFHRILK